MASGKNLCVSCEKSFAVSKSLAICFFCVMKTFYKYFPALYSAYIAFYIVRNSHTDKCFRRLARSNGGLTVDLITVGFVPLISMAQRIAHIFDLRNILIGKVFMLFVYN